MYCGIFVICRLSFVCGCPFHNIYPDRCLYCLALDIGSAVEVWIESNTSLKICREPPRTVRVLTSARYIKRLIRDLALANWQRFPT